MTTQHLGGYTFEGGFPTPETIQKAYNDADLNRAIHAYRFFHPAVAMSAAWSSKLDAGAVPNRTFAFVDGDPRRVASTPIADAATACALLDLREGPIIVDVPPGPLVCSIDDLHQRHVMDLGVPGPDQGHGGLYLIVPPDFRGTLPGGYHVGRSSTFRALLLVRAIPPRGDVEAGIELARHVKLRTLDVAAEPVAMTWLPTREEIPAVDRLETTLEFWRALHDIVDREPALPEYDDAYRELAVLGIEKGKPFLPDRRMIQILERAAEAANAQLRVQSFADRRPNRVVWPGRQWEWPREVIGAGALCWLCLRDRSGAYLDGSKTYKLAVWLPVPASLCWSITAYDPLGNQQLGTLRSRNELADELAGTSVELYFGPTPPASHEARWIETRPGRGWFTYVRIYGPRPAALDGSWRLGDFQIV
jgi:hypothetical protein